jgi:ABC-type nitrate/sulfonate/bicarbonate transport system substrate-binding protein
LLVVVLCVSAAVSIPGYLFPQEPNAARERVVMRLPWVIQTQFAGSIVAARPGGPYERERLDVELRPGGGDVNVMSLVGDGKEEFAITQPDQLVYWNAKATGSQRCVAVGVVFPESMTCFMTRKADGIDSIEKFRGRKVGTKEGTNVHNEFLALVSKAHLDPKTDVVQIPVQWDIGLFINGQVDVFPGFTINEPFTVRKAGVDIDLLTPKQFGLDLYGDVVVTRADYCTKRADTVRRMVAATSAGWKEAKANPAEAVSIVLKRDPLLKVDHQEAMLRACLAMQGESLTGLTPSKPETWAQIVSMLERFGGLTPGKVKPGDLFNNEFLAAK